MSVAGAQQQEVRGLMGGKPCANEIEFSVTCFIRLCCSLHPELLQVVVDRAQSL